MINILLKFRKYFFVRRHSKEPVGNSPFSPAVGNSPQGEGQGWGMYCYYHEDER